MVVLVLLVVLVCVWVFMFVMVEVSSIVVMFRWCKELVFVVKNFFIFVLI